MADHVAVMYAGKIVEEAEVNQLFDAPKHPYTQGLLSSIPVLGQVKERLAAIPGSVPNLRNLPAGCRFASRCQYVMDICRTEEPGLFVLDGHRTSRCWLYADQAAGTLSEDAILETEEHTVPEGGIITAVEAEAALAPAEAEAENTPTPAA
jgi:oligopeptide/dipeptide ABC transporter ATP-binding protein